LGHPRIFKLAASKPMITLATLVADNTIFSSWHISPGGLNYEKAMTNTLDKLAFPALEKP